MTESISNGKFITFEGVDGCGKSTQAEKLVDKLLTLVTSVMSQTFVNKLAFDIIYFPD